MAMSGDKLALGAVALLALGSTVGKRGSFARGKYGRFTRMSRREVQEYLESWGFAVYDDEPLDELRETAWENEKTESGETPSIRQLSEEYEPPEVGLGPMVTHRGWIPGKGFGGDGSENKDELEVVRVQPFRAGFRGADMMKAMARGRVHDPNKTIRVEVTITGPPDKLMSEEARILSLQAARGHMFATWSRRVTRVYRDAVGRQVVRFDVQ